MLAFLVLVRFRLTETEGPAETEGTVTQAQPLDKLPADIAAAIEKAEASTGTVDEQPAASETGATAAETTTPKPTETPAPKEEVASNQLQILKRKQLLRRNQLQLLRLKM